MSLKPICVPCRRFFRCVKHGHYFTEGMPASNGAKPGNEEPSRWKPYKLWAGNKWRCEGCGAEIVSGFGTSPIRIQHEMDFKEVAQALGADKYQVNDC